MSKELFKNLFKKSDTTDSSGPFVTLYKEMIRSYAICVCTYLQNHPQYKHWKQNWDILENNLKKNNLKVEQLKIDHEQIAYTQNKGQLLCFRWKDSQHYIKKDVFIYVVLHELTHQCFPRDFIGHKEPFPTMLCILCFAALELGLYNLENIPENVVMSNGQEIASRLSIKEELMIAINLLIEKNPHLKDYYSKWIKFIYVKCGTNL